MDSVILANGATTPGPAGTDDAQSAGTSVDPMVEGVSSGDPSAGFVVGDPGLAGSADSGGAADASGTAAVVAALRNIGPVEGGGAAAGSADSTASGSQPPIDNVSVNGDLGWGDYASDAGALAGGDAAPAPSGGSLPGTGGGSGSGNAGTSAPIAASAASAGAGPSNTSVAETAPGSTPAASGASGGLIINLIYDSTAIANAPSSFFNGMQLGANLLEAAIQDNITINIDVGYGEINGTALPPGGNISQGSPGNAGLFTDYSSLYTLLRSHETSGADVVLINDLPSATTLNGESAFGISSAEAKALGALSPTDPAVDGFVGIGTNTTGGNLIAAALHEITHAMGRVPGPSLLSLVRYFSPGNHDFDTGSTPATASYFSIDGGVTTLANFGVNSDPSDFLNSPASPLTPNSPFDEAYGGSTLTSVDLAELNVLGFQVAAANFTVSSGQTISDTVINTGDNEFVQSGGVSVITYALSGGLEVVSAGAVDSSAAINAGAAQDVFGSASGVFVYDGGLQVVESGGTASGTTVSLGGTEIVSSGGTASGTTLLGGGGLVETLQDVQSGGTAIGTTLQGVGGGATFQYVEPGGVVSATTVSSGTSEIVSSGGTAIGTTLNGGPTLSTTLNGGTVEFFGGAIISDFTWIAGTLALAAGFTLTGQTVNGGQTLEILAGGSVISTTVNGGYLDLLGGTATGTTIVDGGREAVSSGASVQGEVISSGGLFVYSGGSATSTTIDGGGGETVLAGGLSQFATINGGGSMTVMGEDDVVDGYVPGLAEFTRINSGGSLTVSSGGQEQGAVIGGSETVWGGGEVFSETISSGGLLTVLGGVGDGTIIYSGGSETVSLSGITAIDVLSGGSETVFAGGNAESVVISSGGLLTVSAGGVASNPVVFNGGTLVVDPGGIADPPTISRGGSEIVSSGGTTVSTIISGFSGPGAVLDLLSGAIVSGGITFAGSGGQLQIAGTAPALKISGFTASGDVIDLTSLAFSGTTSVGFSSAMDVLTVIEGGASATIQLDSETYTGVTWVAQSDGVSGTDVAVACFGRGTQILTEAGEVPVEELAIGDKVVTLSGAAQPVKWIGQRSYAARFVRGNRAVLPIRIAAGALAEGVPARDLRVSPEHALYIPGSSPGTGVLVPARQLVNGATMTQDAEVGQVDYFHLELDAHDVIFAEGAAAETFVDCDNRLMFHNAGEFAALYPGDERPAWEFCAKRLEEGSAELTAIRAALLERAETLGHALDSDPDLHLIVDGEIVRAHSATPFLYRFEVPAGGAALWLASRSTVPAETTAGSRDIRRLGVAVERIALNDGDLSIEAGHDHPTLGTGFHEDEATHRWTDGLARLPEAWLRSFPGTFTLEVHLAASGLGYRLPAPARADAAAA